MSVSEAENTNVELEYVLIKRLHGRQDISLFCAGRVTIFIADNGSGKTTSLDIVQCILSRRFSRLQRFRYESITVKFADAEPFVITPRDIEISRSSRALRSMVARSDIPLAVIADLARQVRHVPYARLRETTLMTTAARQLRLPIKVLYDRLVRIDFQKEDQQDLLSGAENSALLNLSEFLEANFHSTTLYFPTYRRVERHIEQLLEFEDDEDKITDPDIHFGMKDVVLKIEAATKDIRDHFVTSYGRISGEMLGQLAENTPISDAMRLRLSDSASVQLVLGKVGSNITTVQKSLITDMYQSGRILDNKHLSFFLSRLIEAYDQVRDKDTALQQYANVCNGYLSNKHLQYDSLNAILELHESATGDVLDFEHLSSGEKQILGIMSDIYLGKNASHAIIFDEPELSLSVEWQRKILVDVASAKKCHMLIAATHSPFVFENELDSQARSLSVHYHHTTARVQSNDLS